MMIIAGGVLYTVPRSVDVTIQAVQYRLGVHDAIRPVTVKIDGRWRRKLSGLRTFQGTIDINGASVANPDNHRPTTVRFERNGAGLLVGVLCPRSARGL